MAENSLIPFQGSRLLPMVRLLAIALLTLAISFRFANLDRKVYWHDEVYTSMVITARPGNYLSKDLFQNKLARPSDLLAYQRFVPTLTLPDMVVRKGLEDSQHPPLYYLLLRFWAQVGGTSPATLRGFSALLSLLIFPSLYWLCWELFKSHLSGWVAVSLFAVSPLHLVYAQEAREFGFWTGLILASSALLLRAIRSPSRCNWRLYAVAITISFYTALFTLWIALGHFFYTLLMDEENQFFKRPLRIGKRTGFCVLALVGGIVFLIPWIYVMLASKDALGATTSWTSIPLPMLISIQASIANFSRGFVDFNLGLDQPVALLLAIPVLLLQVYAVYVLCCNAGRHIWWFIFTFVGSTALAFGLPDLLFGGQLFTVTRYMIPCFVGLQLAVVYLLTIGLNQPRKWKVGFAMVCFVALMILGVLSCGSYSQSNTWWNKVLNSNYHQVADIINHSDRPLIIVDSFGYNAASMVSLSYLLKPNSEFLLLPPVGKSFTVKALPPETQTIFLMNLPDSFRHQFEVRYHQKSELVFEDPWNHLWKMK